MLRHFSRRKVSGSHCGAAALDPHLFVRETQVNSFHFQTALSGIKAGFVCAPCKSMPLCNGVFWREIGKAQKVKLKNLYKFLMKEGILHTKNEEYFELVHE